MKVSKAIEILDENVKAKPPGMNHDYFNALKLGIEALKHREKQRQYNLAFSDDLLPGETPEDDAT